jgi:hypothetical protein
LKPYFSEAWTAGDARAPRYRVNDAKDGCREYGAPTRHDGRGNYGNSRQPSALRGGAVHKARRTHNKRARAVLARDLRARENE